MGIRYKYTEYKDFPEASAASKNINGFRMVLSCLGICFAIIAFCFKEILGGILCIVLVVVIQPLATWLEKWRVRQIIEQQTEERQHLVSFDELQMAKAYHRKARYFLSLGTHDKEFKEEAYKNGMDVKEFKQKCKQDIQKYDEIYAQYNRSHPGERHEY